MFSLKTSDKIAITNNEIMQLEAQLYTLELRARVQKRMGDTGKIEAIEKDMVGLEAGIDEMKEELATLDELIEKEKREKDKNKNEES